MMYLKVQCYNGSKLRHIHFNNKTKFNKIKKKNMECNMFIGKNMNYYLANIFICYCFGHSIPQLCLQEGRKCFIYRHTQHILFTVIWSQTYGKEPLR